MGGWWMVDVGGHGCGLWWIRIQASGILVLVQVRNLQKRPGSGPHS
jgi:hypothetical protein